MLDPLSGYVFVRGNIIKKLDSTLIITFHQSSALWDENDIGNLGGQLRLEDVTNANTFAVGEEVIAKGVIHYKGALKTTEVNKNQFQPFGIDWKPTLLFILMILLLALIFIAHKGLKISRLSRHSKGV